MTSANGRADRAFDFGCAWGIFFALIYKIHLCSHMPCLYYISWLCSRKWRPIGKLASDSRIIRQDPLWVWKKTWGCSWDKPTALGPAPQPPHTRDAHGRGCAPELQERACGPTGCQVGLWLSPESCCAVPREGRAHRACCLLYFLKPIHIYNPSSKT